MVWFFGRRKAPKAATTEHQLTPDFVARDLATMLAGTMDSPEVAEVLAEAGEAYSPERRLEWLIINTFATTQGFLASDLSEPFKQAFVPAFVSAVASYSFHKFESREQFTAQFYERVQEYGPAHAASAENPQALALLFGRRLTSTPDPEVILFARGVFHKELIAANQFADKIAAMAAGTSD